MEKDICIAVWNFSVTDNYELVCVRTFVHNKASKKPPIRTQPK